MANILSSWQLKHLGDFVDALNKMRRDHHVDVCAYGPITLAVGDDAYVTLARSSDDDPDVPRDTYHVEVGTI